MPLASWGTLSPLEPAENVLCLVPIAEGDDALVYHRYLQLFAERAAVLGRVRKVLAREVVPRVGQALDSLPSHVRLDIGSPLGPEGIGRLFASALARVPVDRLETACRLLENFRGRPLERANHEAYLTMTSASRRARQDEADEPAPTTLEPAVFVRWWALVTDPGHVRAERLAIQSAWDGVLAFQRGGARHPRKPVRTWEQAARLLERLAHAHA